MFKINKMGSNNIEKVILLTSTSLGFLITYFGELTATNCKQFLAIVSVIFLDGFFGILAGIKREGFKTYKALKILKTLFGWILILFSILIVEEAYPIISWLSETILAPFIIFQLISALKNASMVGFIKVNELNIILDKIDKHKGERKEGK